MDRIDAMRLFIAVADHGGFSNAARREGVSPAHVSKKVAKLEALLGARLLERTTRTVSLTPAGAAYLERAKSIVADLDALEDGVRAAHAEAAGVIRLSAPVDFGARRLTPIVLDFMDAHPGVEVRLSLNDRFVDLIDEGFDAAVRIGALEDSSLIARRLTSACMAVAVAPEHPAAAAVRTPQDLASQPCIIDSNAEHPRRWRFLKSGDACEVRVRGRFTVNSPEAVRRAALRGHGVARTPEFALAEDMRAGRLVGLLPDWAPEPRDVWVVFPQNRFLSARLRLLVEHLATAFAGDRSG